MKVKLLLLSCLIILCSGVRLNPLENNDKLQDITNLYVAEWQWESWPIKQDPTEQERKSPGQRKNFALWKDSYGSAWYLFGGQPVNGDPRKVFSDIWKFTVKTRAWKRLFPSQTDIKSVNTNKTGGVTPLRVNLFDDGNPFFLQKTQIILCGGLGKKNPGKVKKIKAWSGYKRKMEEEETEDRLTSLAVYAPKTVKSNTVWQIDAKNKLWTTYVCCCDTVKSKNDNMTSNMTKTVVNKNKISRSNQTADNFEIEKGAESAKNDCSVLDSKINKAEDEMDNEQEHMKISSLKNKKKKINQTKNTGEKFFYKKIKIDKRGGESNKGKQNDTKPESSNAVENKTSEGLNITNGNVTMKKTRILKPKIEGKNQTVKSEKPGQFKMASKFCPEFSESGTSVTWCDGKHEALITSDVSLPEITLWVFNLSTSHWSQLQVKIPNGMKWPACPDMNSVRYAGNEEDVYIVCSRGKTSDLQKPSGDSTDPSEVPSKDNFNEKLVFRINYRKRVLYDLGSIRLNPYFNSPEGERVWQNESQAILQVVGSSINETILVLAYMDMVDLWVLSKEADGEEGFHLVEKIWRGSALKWFDKYNAALYSVQFVSESGHSETILLPNPRKVAVNDYWPRERGRFIIRVFRNENLKNQSFENRTREQNLTYELLQSDYKPIGNENQLNHVYSLKVLVFFGISLAIFFVFGVVLFLKRCVNCPPRISVRNECHKSPLVIRYSVIPDDLLYPVA